MKIGLVALIENLVKSASMILLIKQYPLKNEIVIILPNQKKIKLYCIILNEIDKYFKSPISLKDLLWKWKSKDTFLKLISKLNFG